MTGSKRSRIGPDRKEIEDLRSRHVFVDCVRVRRRDEAHGRGSRCFDEEGKKGRISMCASGPY